VSDPTNKPGANLSPGEDQASSAFETLCRQLQGFDERLDPEWLDGYFTALLAGRRTVLPSEWMPKALGDAFDRAFADPQAVGQAMQVLMGRWNEIARALHPDALLDRPDELHLSPLMVVWDDEARAEVQAESGLTDDDARQLQTGAIWAMGFFDAVRDFEPDWPEPGEAAPDAEHHLSAMHDLAMLLADPAEPDYQAHLEALVEPGSGQGPGRGAVIDAALFAVQDLRLYWLDHGPTPTQRRVGPTPGRNDPCPCGSGRKYKKCHGADA